MALSREDAYKQIEQALTDEKQARQKDAEAHQQTVAALEAELEGLRTQG